MNHWMCARKRRGLQYRVSTRFNVCFIAVVDMQGHGKMGGAPSLYVESEAVVSIELIAIFCRCKCPGMFNSPTFYFLESETG